MKQFYHLCTIFFVIFSLWGSRESLVALDKSLDLHQCRLDTWRSKEGLPSRSIDAIAQTPDGYLWLASRSGLVRFDGVRFQIYNSSNTIDFKRSMVRSLTVSPKGELWIGTDGGGFGRFEPGRFTPFLVEHGKPGWSEQKALYFASDGSLWVGGRGSNPLIHIEDKKTSFYLEDANINAITQDSKGRIWIAGESPTLAIQEKDGKFHNFIAKEGFPKGVAATALWADRDGSVWVGTNGAGLFRYQDGKFHNYSIKEGITTLIINTIRRDQSDTLWVGGQNGLYREEEGHFTRYQNPDGAFAPKVGAILEDREENLWVCNDTYLHRFNNTKLTPIDLSNATGTLATSGVCHTADGSIWGSSNLGVTHLEDGKRTNYTTAQGLPENDIASIFAGFDNTVWVATSNGSYAFWNGSCFVTLTQKKSVFQIGVDKNGLVVADQSGDYYRYQNGKFNKLKSNLKSNYTFVFYRDSYGQLWCANDVAFGKVGADRIDWITQGLPPEAHVLGLAEGGTPEEMWLATDKGLGRYCLGKIRMWGREHGLPDDNLYQIHLDKANNLWIGCNVGIFSVPTGDLLNPEHHALRVATYGTLHGIRSFPIVMGSTQTSDGRLWFRGETGLTMFNPIRLPFNNIAPRVHLEKVVSDGKEYLGQKRITLAPGKNNLEIHYTGISLTLPEQVTFRYKLEGYDEDWVTADNRHVAYYTNLPPGNYRFSLKAANEDGVWSMPVSDLQFELRPFFYQTLWFKVSSVLVGIGGILGIFRWRIQRFKRYNQMLSARVAERTQELAQSNKELRAIHSCLEEANAELEAAYDEMAASNNELAISNSKLEEANQKLATLATTDGLTGLHNHRAFQEKLRHELALSSRLEWSLGLLLLDVDYFKQYNDSFGHPAGDEVLRTIGRLLKENVREIDHVARYGGEEFAIILPNTDAKATQEIGERIRKVIAEYSFPYRTITMSVGAAVIHENRIDPEALVECADMALYDSKHSGRNRLTLIEEQPATLAA